MSEESLSKASPESQERSGQADLPTSTDAEVIKAQPDKALSGKGAFIRRELFVGPLPHPEYFKQYEEVLPGAADRILRMAEEEGKHRRVTETYVIRHETYLQYLGLAAGLLIAILALTFGYLLILNNKDVYGFTMILSTLGGVVGIWWYRIRIEEREKKQESSRAEK